jgi:hypothetical protein
VRQDADVTSDPTPLDSLRRAAEELAEEVTAIVPRLVGRSREQLSVALSFAERLPCADWFGLGARGPERPDLRVVEGGGEDDVEPEPLPPTRRAPVTPVAEQAPPAAPAPAKKAPAKTAPAAKKATAKKAPATKRPAAKKAPAKRATPTKAAAAAVAGPAPVPTSDALAVPDYDELAASQVIPRLDSLSPGELESIRSYEAAHRARRTILNRISQLQ